MKIRLLSPAGGLSLVGLLLFLNLPLASSAEGASGISQAEVSASPVLDTGTPPAPSTTPSPPGPKLHDFSGLIRHGYHQPRGFSVPSIGNHNCLSYTRDKFDTTLQLNAQAAPNCLPFPVHFDQ